MMKKFWQIKNEAEADNAEMLIYGEIADTTWWGDEVTPKQFADDLKALEGKDLTVRVNSPGGDVFAAQAIYNQLKSYAGHVTMRIDGLAASAATIITCAGDTVIMPDNALFMIHNPKGAFLGYYDAKTLSEYAKQLDVVRQTIVNVYKKRCGNNLSDTQIKHKMDDETWMTAQEALDYGFIDQLDTDTEITNSLKDGMLIMNSVSCDLSRFKRGKEVAEILNRKAVHKGEKSPETPKNCSFKEENPMENKDLLEKIKNLLGMETEQTPAEPKAPEVQNAAEDDPVAVERERLLALDALDDHKNGAITKMVNAAKANGSTVEQVKPFIDALREEGEQKDEQANVLDAIKALIKDEMQSGAQQVAPSAPQATPEEAKQAAIDEVVNLANKERG